MTSPLFTHAKNVPTRVVCWFNIMRIDDRYVHGGVHWTYFSATTYAPRSCTVYRIKVIPK